MAVEITLQTVFIFAAFIIGVFLIYRTFKILIRGSLVVVASFAFPWVAQNMGLPIIASLSSAVNFAVLGFGLFLVYEFFHIIVYLFKAVTWPLRVLFGRRKKK